jgi:hypothetical protein
MIPGVVIQMGGHDWQVPPLTLGNLKQLWPKIQKMKMTTDTSALMDQFDDVIELIEVALKRNYPDVTRDELLDLLDMGNLQAVITAVMQGSGLKPGEAEAVTARPNGGFPSMDSTSPPQV